MEFLSSVLGHICYVAVIFSAGALTPPTTISRMRRQVQEQNVELRGKHYKGRQTTMQNKWKKDLGYEVF